MSMMRKHLLPVVGQHVYPPNLWTEHSTDQGPPGETTGLDKVVAHLVRVPDEGRIWSGNYAETVASLQRSWRKRLVASRVPYLG